MSVLGPAAIAALVALSTPNPDAGPGGPRLTATASAADPLLDEAPLSPDELALLEALDDAVEAPPPWTSAWGAPPDPTRPWTLSAARLDETVARGVLGAVDAHPGLRGRWRWGPRSGRTVDGLVLDAPLLRQTWARAHPGLFGAVRAARIPRTEDPIGGLGGHLALSTGRARFDAGFSGEVGTALRVADRGLETQLDLQYGGRRAAVRAFAAIGHQDDLRRGGETDPLPERGARATAGLDARARPFDALTVDLRGALTTDRRATLDDGAGGAVATDLFGWIVTGGARLASAEDRHAIAVRGGLSRAEASFDGGEIAARTAQVDLQSHATLLEGDEGDRLRGLAGGRLVRATRADRARARETGYLGVDGRWGRLTGRGLLRVARFGADDGRSDVALLPEGGLDVALVGGLSAGLHVARRAAQDVAGEPGPQRAWTVRGGPRFRGDGLWLDLDIGAAWVDRPQLAEGDVDVILVEADGGARIWGGLELAAAVAWAEGVDPTETARFAWPRLRGHVALRYGFAAPAGFIELRVRGTSRAWRARSADDGAVYEDGFVRVGLAGQVELGAGFTLSLTVENALDRQGLEIDGPLAAPGVDVRARLAWRW